MALLKKPIWNCNDIMRFFGCKKSKAYEIISKVKKYFNGATNYSPSYVKRDSVLLYAGTSIEREVYIENLTKKGGRNEKTL